MHPIVNVALKAARKAGDVMLQSLDRLDTINPMAKGHRDFVTNIDRRAEKEIITLLKKNYPNHAIIAEESGQYHGDKDSVWIIDPLDGTHNYLRGFPHFCVSIGFQYKGKIEHGLVYDPIRQEVFSATRGHGARLNDRRLRISETARLENALIGTGFPVRNPEHLPDYLDSFKTLMPHLADMRCSGSAALDLCYVAAARLDAFLETRLHIWDLAAGSLIVKEAGGIVTDWQGEGEYLEKGAVIAATPRISNLLLGIINEKLAVSLASSTRT